MKNYKIYPNIRFVNKHHIKPCISNKIKKMSRKTNGLNPIHRKRLHTNISLKKYLDTKMLSETYIPKKTEAFVRFPFP